MVDYLEVLDDVIRAANRRAETRTAHSVDDVDAAIRKAKLLQEQAAERKRQRDPLDIAQFSTPRPGVIGVGDRRFEGMIGYDPHQDALIVTDVFEGVTTTHVVPRCLVTMTDPYEREDAERFAAAV